MHYIDFAKVRATTRKRRLFGMLVVLIFALVAVILMLNSQSSQASSINIGILSTLKFL